MTSCRAFWNSKSKAMNLNVKYDVFVSYSRKDYVDESGHPIEGSPIAELLRFLDDNRITYWIDKDGVYSGSEFVEVITDAITESKMLIFVSSQHSNDSKYTTGEIFEALAQDKLIVPFKIDESPYNKSYRMMVRPLDFIEYYSNHQLAFEALLKTINVCKKEYEELLLEEERKKAEADARRRIAEIEKEIKNEVSEYQHYASNLDIKAHQIVEKQKQIGNIQKKCPICTTSLPVESKYCPKCGWSFNPVFDISPNGDKDHVFLMQSNWKSLKDSVQIEDQLNETITGLKNSINEKDATIESLHKKVSQIQDIVKNLEVVKSERSELQNNLYDLQQKLKKAESETQNILEQSRAKEEHLQSRIEDLSQRLASTNNKLSNKDGEIARLEATLSNTKAALSSTQQKLQAYKNSETKQKSNTINGHEYVDLGLSVKWATCNVGASSPEGYGDYFAWGETRPKNDYSWSTLKYCNDNSGDSFSKYNQNQGGTRDNRTRLELSDDAARANWGGSWRMPTRAEQEELRDLCDWQWTTVNGHKGYRVTSRRNGRRIFLPAAGCYEGSRLCEVGVFGNYWSSSLSSSSSYLAYRLALTSGLVDMSYYEARSIGQSVRAVSE